jgi:molybdopterin converting factor subunit 1
MSLQTVHIHYFALLREQRGLSQETVTTAAQTAEDLYRELQHKHNLGISKDLLKVAVNSEFKDWKTPIYTNDTIVFIPPVAGG